MMKKKRLPPKRLSGEANNNMNIVRDIFIKKASNAQLLARLNLLINSSVPALAKLLVRNWQNQANAITYKELREMIESENINPEILFQWKQDYSLFVTTTLLPVWENAIKQASNEYKERYKEFYFDSNDIGVRVWNEQNAARFVTNCTSQQIDALAAVVRCATELDGMSSTELARVIRPMIGLNKPQAEANMRFYQSLIGNGVSEKKAREQSIKYTERQQRYRAQMIARTEIAASYNEGRDIAVKQAQKQGFMGKCRRVWITADTERTCDYCTSLDGTDVGMDEDFIMEIGKKVPRTVKVRCPPAHPHCMCVLNYEEIEPPISVNDNSYETAAMADVEEVDWSGTKPIPHTNDDYLEIVEYAKNKGIGIFDVKSFDGDLDILREQLDVLHSLRNDYNITSRLVIRFSSMENDIATFAETNSSGTCITFNKMALRSREITNAILNADKYLSSTDIKGIAAHEMGHIISRKYGEKGIDIAKQVYYNIYNKEISDFDIVRYLKREVSIYSVIIKERYMQKPFNKNYYKEVIPELIAKNMTNPNEFTSEFIKLLKELFL